MSVRDHDKGRRYIALLDTARCNGAWTEVPELLRKVNKHAPGRKCLITTATAEYNIATNGAASRPGTATTQHDSILSTLIPNVLSAIETETQYPQDRLQAQTCLAWIHWVLAEPALAASRLPKDYGAVIQELKGSLSGWTEVCLVKGACLKGTAQSQSGAYDEAMETFQTLLPWVTASTASSASSKEYSSWAAQYLAQLAMLASRDEAFQPVSALQAFRLWATKVQKQQASSIDPGSGFVFPATPQIWKAYYQLVSRLLQEGYEYPDEGDLAPRVQQYAEIKRVEAMHENILLKTVRFPKAHDSSIEIDAWVDSVIRNWKILCGPSWRDEDIGQGGKDAVTRTVLDILYRAATKTFHSTLVLRRLFQVHKSLAEFHLAYKALDTYLEIVNRGKAKALKAGEPATDIDDNDTTIRTLAEGIEGLCCFGAAGEAEKAKDLASTIEEWIGTTDEGQNGFVNGDNGSSVVEPEQISANTTAIAHRAIGVALAQWARYTPFSEDRSSIQTEAISHLEKSVKINSPGFSNYEAYFAMGLILAETRDLDGAIVYVKEALASPDLASASGSSREFARERKLMPMWHLMALILSGRQDFTTAEKACEGALEQFSSPFVLFGQNHRKQINSLSNEKHSQPHSEGLVDSMTGLELERLIEIRMTEIALVEVVEGPEVAVNSTDELLSLFVRLFGDLGIDAEEKPANAQLVPPKSSAGTVKSFRGSIFHRKKEGGTSIRHSALPERLNPIGEKGVVRSPSVHTNAPTIQVTDEARQTLPATQDHPHHRLHRREGSITRKVRERSEERRASRPATSYDSSRRQSFETGREDLSGTSSAQGDRKLHTSDGLQGHANGATTATTGLLPQSTSPTAGVTQSPSAKQNLPEVPHNYHHESMPPPAGHREQPPQQDVRLPTVTSHTHLTEPVPQFPRLQSRKHALGILTKIWLLIAALYRRATMFEDSREACLEAQRHANTIEALIASHESSARAFSDPGWGGTKSSDEIWADVYAERGLLALARTAPYEAIDHLEEALTYFPYHGKATIALSNILLDIYTQKLPSEKPQPSLDAALPDPPSTNGTSPNPKTPTITTSDNNTTTPAPPPPSTEEPSSTSEPLRKTPSNLSRLAARDRAYGLLSSYTKLGSGWSDSEAWFALARAHEESGQIDKAREVLWWCVELEDTKPVRGFGSALGSGGYVL